MSTAVMREGQIGRRVGEVDWVVCGREGFQFDSGRVGQSRQTLLAMFAPVDMLFEQERAIGLICCQKTQENIVVGTGTWSLARR
ncbi:MAG: hypothetical protein AAFX06_31440, partial [Planctomycetota bacterium]